ncbi:hypothetical protein MLD38_011652 [Melastoma candidum]|uniref:Uncharacterized protein n=1 Tax=Melastoma candidum TaxID=119954 RepID=A0ACB9R7V4_9MYRT|nr:hypothetical protein MLD38_011652 [Melastoma candidum]
MGPGRQLSRMKSISPALHLALLVFLLGRACASVNDFGRCERVVKEWARTVQDTESKEDKHSLRDLLFFLHVPRTGGRTYFYCFLKKLYPADIECPRSYDKLRFDPSKEKCRLLVTHDDYSLLSKLPKERTSVVTILRNPIDRVFSAYEFSIEVAARFLIHPNLTSATRMAGRLRAKSKGVSTLDIWPWKYLVPWMREDLFARRDARKQSGSVRIKSKDPYQMEEMVMPLHKYLEDPIAQDIVHNGATFQITGLTNNSFFAEAHEVRHCVTKFRELGGHVLQVAKRRLTEMLYVGLTEEHRESATMFANVVGAQVISQLRGSNYVAENSTEIHGSSQKASSHSDDHSTADPDHQNMTDIASTSQGKGELSKDNMTVDRLIGVYESCISNLRKTQSTRRISSLKNVAPANFTKEARHNVDIAVLQKIESLNYLDVDLYKYAQEIFSQQHGRSTPKPSVTELNSGNDSPHGYMGWNVAYGCCSHWYLATLFLPVILLVSLVFYVNSRRRISKVKI